MTESEAATFDEDQVAEHLDYARFFEEFGGESEEHFQDLDRILQRASPDYAQGKGVVFLSLQEARRRWNERLVGISIEQ